MWVRFGEIHAGTKDKPREKKLTFTTMGHYRSYVLQDPNVIVNNKVIWNTGLVELYGKSSSTSFTKKL